MAVAEKIDLYPVQSSNLQALGYNESKEIAAVQFKSGDVFHYAGVSHALMEEWLQSESFGRFYATRIRGKFSGQKMTGHCADCGAGGWVGDRCADCGCGDYQEDQRV